MIRTFSPRSRYDRGIMSRFVAQTPAKAQDKSCVFIKSLAQLLGHKTLVSAASSLMPALRYLRKAGGATRVSTRQTRVSAPHFCAQAISETSAALSLSLLVGLFGSYAAGQTAQVGKSQYQARCVGCHGEDGTGGGHGPNVVDVRRPRATTVEALSSLILKGIPDAGMPAFPISAEEAR